MKTEKVSPTPAPNAVRAACPRCGDTGKPVKLITLQSLLKPEALTRVGSGLYRFCQSEACPVVYFPESDGSVFTPSDLTVRVGIKESTPPRLVCYCFNHTVEEIEEQVRLTGKTTVLDDIKTRMKEACWCETKSPLGSCCLSTVTKYVKAAARFGAGKPEAATNAKTEDCCAAHTGSAAMETPQPDAAANRSARIANPTVSRACRAERIAWIGSVGSAVVASACCWLPLLLLAFGVSGVAVSATFEKYRTLFATLTFGFLAAAFYFAYRPKPKAVAGSAGEGDVCCASTAPQGECCPPEQRGKWTLQRLNRVMLWVVTAIALAFVLFPNYVGALLGGKQDAGFGANVEQYFVAVEGMNCAGCATSLEKALAKIPGVGVARVSYQKKEAVIGVPKGTPAPREQVLSVIAAAGFTGRFQDVETRTLSIAGMTCEACAARIQTALGQVPGVRSAQVNFEKKTAMVVANATLAKDALTKAVESAGYRVAPASTPTTAPANEREDQ